MYNIAKVLKTFIQGLDVDHEGKVTTALRGQPFAYRNDFVHTQEHWASQTDKGFSEWVDNVNALGGKAMDISGIMSF